MERRGGQVAVQRRRTAGSGG